MVPVTLTCPRCGSDFVIAQWRAKKAAKEGRKPFCSKNCASESRRTRTPEMIAEYHRTYREKNRAWINEKQNAARFGPQRGHILKRDRENYRKNAERERARARAYAAAHKDAAYTRRRLWAKDNPEKALFHMVRSNLAVKFGLKPRDIPRDIVEAHMAYLELYRWVRAQGMPAE